MGSAVLTTRLRTGLKSIKKPFPKYFSTDNGIIIDDDFVNCNGTSAKSTSDFHHRRHSTRRLKVTIGFQTSLRSFVANVELHMEWQSAHVFISIGGFDDETSIRRVGKIDDALRQTAQNVYCHNIRRVIAAFANRQSDVRTAMTHVARHLSNRRRARGEWEGGWGGKW